LDQLFEAQDAPNEYGTPVGPDGEPLPICKSLPVDLDSLHDEVIKALNDENYIDFSLLDLCRSEDDADGDGYMDTAAGGDDCNDSKAFINPGLSEICDDGYDNDCSGNADCDDTACLDDEACKSSTSDCSEEYTQYHEQELTLYRYCGFGSEGGLICSRYGFSGCANACVNTDSYPPGAGSVFNLWACSSYSGYASCASSAFTAYVGCLEACNADFLAGEWGTKWGEEFYILHNVCAPECQDQVNQVLNDQCVAE
jgi:hypothetical protein